MATTRERKPRSTSTKRGSIIKSKTTRQDGVVQHHPSISKEFDVDFEDLKFTGHVSVTGALTKNMGDFNNVKIGIMVSLPCDYRTDAGVDAAKERAAKLMDKYLDEEYKTAITDTAFDADIED
jgi:hypothetical protein